MKRTDEFLFPSFLNECAVILGKRRVENNTKLRQENPRFERGENNDTYDIIGVQAELAFGFFLFINGYEYQFAPLVIDHPISSWDFRFNGYNFDIKGMLPESTELKVNEESHLKCKNIDFYVFLKIIRSDERVSTARYWIFGWKEVSQWQVVKLAYSNAYVLGLDKIKSVLKDE